MGVHGLWELLAPVGRRVSVETLAGKRLAIDASIWMIQFMKAMRDEKGEMVRNAHILGFFRRICKLLFLRTKPVFVFDGGTPALKRRTVIARRRQRENAQTKIRKTAEKLLLNHLKAMKLKQLAEEMKTQRKENNAKGKKVVVDEDDSVGKDSEKNDAGSESYNQEKLDEMLAASLAAEEDGRFPGNASTSAAGVISEEDDDDGEEEMILPAMHGNVDPAVLAALPPSMQLDLLVQMRERLMAENRQKYQKVKKAPQKFSELQIQSYLKTVAFRREIDGVQKSAAGRGVGGVQTSRIASEANREFIFSSSFSGDKEALASGGVEKVSDKQHQVPSECPQDSLDKHAPTATSSIDTELGMHKSGEVVHDNVETYLDERGCVRVSRLRAMGIRMTRDLQRNLDMMREIEQEKRDKNDLANSVATAASDISAERNFPSVNQFVEMSNEMNDVTDCSNNRDKLTVPEKRALEISFEDDVEQKCPDGDDDIFARLVAGDSVIISSVDNTSGRKHSFDSGSDSDWEEGIIGEKQDGSFTNDTMEEIKPSSADANTNDDTEVDWEYGVSPEHLKAVSRGVLEEEADFQEAIKRSLEDLSAEESINTSSEKEKMETPEAKPSDAYPGSQSDFSRRRNEIEEMLDPELVSQTETKEIHFSTKKLLDNSDRVPEVSSFANICVGKTDCNPDFGLVNVPGGVIVDAHDDYLKSASTCLSDETTVPAVLQGTSPVKEATYNDIHIEQKMTKDVHRDDFTFERETEVGCFGNGDIRMVQDEVTEASLAEEISILGQECVNLGDEQRKLERNAESVSSEMFAECQELLQMFGLPYIIAPMEAEAQCAYMEFTGFVDGVVTDDSDVFLFGARSVYKNIFDDRKYVETYLMKDIENELGLSREKLIRMALLLGSDYTEGVSGIGIVNAIEVVNAFPDEDGLHKFREWIESPDPTILGKFEEPISSSKEKGPKVCDKDGSCSESEKELSLPGQNVSEGCEHKSADQIQDIQQIFMDKHRKVSKNWHIPSSFPSEAVISAYVDPQVDRSTEPFSWGKPDLFVLRKLCWEKFAWSNQKADELLLPVLKEYNKHESQLRLEAFYTFNERFAKIRSKRIKKAVKGIAGNQSLEVMDGSAQDGPKSKKLKRASLDGLKDDISEDISGKKDPVDGSQRHSAEKSSAKLSSKRKTREKPASCELGTMGAESMRSTKRVSSESRRGRGRGRGWQIQSGRRKNRLEFGETSTSDSNCSENEQEIHSEKEPHKVRRSTRPRNTVNYTVDDLDIDNVDNSIDNSNEECADAVPDETEPEPPSPQITSEDGGGDLIEKDQHNSDDLLPLEGLCNNFLETEDGFCMEKDHNDKWNSSFKADISEDYLRMGGGFCMDEDERDKEPDESDVNPTSATVCEHIDLSHISASAASELHIHPDQSVHSPNKSPVGPKDGGIMDADNSGQSMNCLRATSDVLKSFIENPKDDAGSTSALSAMPLLRRKRRKNS